MAFELGCHVRSDNPSARSSAPHIEDAVRRMLNHRAAGEAKAAAPSGAVAAVPAREKADAEAMVLAARQWALSLSPSKGIPGRRIEDVRLILPPLPALKEYVSGSAPGGASLQYKQGNEGGVFGAGPMAVQAATKPSSPEAYFEDMYEEPSCFQPPKFSALGSNAPRGWSEDKPKAITSVPSDFAAAVSSARQAKPRRDHLEMAHPVTAREARPRQSMQRCRRSPAMTVWKTATVARPEGRPAVRGTDPMAGGLFSRDTHLDASTQRKGVYEAQLRGTFTSPK